MYVQVVTKQLLTVDSNEGNLIIPQTEIHDTIISDNIEAVKNNFNCILNRLIIYTDGQQNVMPEKSDLDFTKEWKIDESHSAEIKVMINGKLNLYKFFVRNTNLNFSFYR